MRTFKNLTSIFYLLTITTILFLTKGEFCIASEWSITFIRDGNVWIASPDGAKTKQLTTLQSSRNPSISPDGKMIVFTSGYDPKTGFGSLYFMTPKC
ncbi:MAG: hypothetical protein N3A59_08750 [Thermodesulfovibrionales bacterium]|nr:hypothetical protein [Thermodesulfovibrionales bacterium]